MLMELLMLQMVGHISMKMMMIFGLGMNKNISCGTPKQIFHMDSLKMQLGRASFIALLGPQIPLAEI
jgi:hypothetical protein